MSYGTLNCLQITTYGLPIYSFSDSVRRRCSVLQWHPDFATQLIVASDDDSSPSLRVMIYAFLYVSTTIYFILLFTFWFGMQIWDMRNTMSPLRELVGHNKGMLCSHI